MTTSVRSRTAAALIAAALTGAGLIATTANAAITGGSGGIQGIAAPASAEPGQLTHDSLIRTWNEQADGKLAAGVVVDATEPGTYDAEADLAEATIPAGTYVRSHMLHADQAGGCPSYCTVSASVSFDRDIIGIVLAPDKLDATDAVLGAPTTAYATGAGFRGLELTGSAADTVTISADRRTVSVTFNFGSAIDGLRVITAGDNYAPVARNNVYDIVEDQQLDTGIEQGVLANDTDANGDVLSASLVSGPTNGTVALGQKGRLIYTPDPDFNGTDTITYQASDGSLTDTATVTIRVAAVADATALFAAPALLSTNPDTQGVFIQYTARLVDHNGNPLADQLIRFHVGDTYKCFAITDANGLASCGNEIDALEAAFSGGYTASFEGVPDVWQPSSADAPALS